jgi:hypothetical protein
VSEWREVGRGWRLARRTARRAAPRGRAALPFFTCISNETREWLALGWGCGSPVVARVVVPCMAVDPQTRQLRVAIYRAGQA